MNGHGDEVYAAEEMLYEYFVEGAPALLRDNICPQKGLVNNAPCLLETCQLAFSCAAAKLLFRK